MGQFVASRLANLMMAGGVSCWGKDVGSVLVEVEYLRGIGICMKVALNDHWVVFVGMSAVCLCMICLRLCSYRGCVLLCLFV